MLRIRPLLLCMLLAGALCSSAPAGAHDVDGPGDCQRHLIDLGDAPEDILAYPGVIGRFPTCMASSAPGTQSFNCAPNSSPPGPTGFVFHDTPATGSRYWLGCGPTTAPLGIDAEGDGKVNLTGGGNPSVCAAATITDCTEAAFGLTFGQDESYGDDDAGLASAPVLHVCSTSSVTFRASSCQSVAITVYLNVLVDLNRDGDWNDNVYCTLPGGCAYEWAVKNVPVTLQPGCNTLQSPGFLLGPNDGEGWLRITLTDQPVNDDFPWAGSATWPGGRLPGGETEDYPVAIRPGSPDPCEGAYHDFGDAPEGIAAYPGGVLGSFPTCRRFSIPTTADLACPSNDPAPGPNGYVEHVTLATDAHKISLGCGDPFVATLAIDGEPDGKVNLVGANSPSECDPVAITDNGEVAFGGMTFGQDECLNDADAGVGAVSFTACTPATVRFNTFNCGVSTEGYLNILVDMNQDGDWTDNFLCGTQCAPEWAVRNQRIPLPAGCLAQLSPAFLIGPFAGHGWMRVTVTLHEVPDDFAWNGSVGFPGGTFRGGETEDYPVEIGANCDLAYRDFGDAPEGFAATSTYFGAYPTCIGAIAPAGGQEIECGAAQSVPPPAGALAGYVEHAADAAAGHRFWFGCGPTPANGIDAEPDGKSSPGGPQSRCGGIPVDCVDTAFGLSFGQDECYGDGDAGLGAPIQFGACSTAAVDFRAFACDHAQDAYLNILVDWSQDGDWNDNVRCGPAGASAGCAPEWVVKNVPVTLLPGCNGYTSPAFQVGPRAGASWMRMSLSADRVPEDFPWNGSQAAVGGALAGGETEDYPVTILPPTTEVGASMPTDGVWLAALSPNPGTSRTTVRFGLPRETDVTLTVYDLLGRRVSRLVEGRLAAGPHAIEWSYRDADGHEVPVGFYLMRLEADGRVLTRRAIRAQ